MANSWTPGPWEMIVDDTGGPYDGWPSVVAPEDVDASVVHRAGFKQEFWGDWSQRQAIANARLIAHAPEMAEALAGAERELTRQWCRIAPKASNADYTENTFADKDPEIVAIRALLSRIRGEAEGP